MIQKILKTFLLCSTIFTSYASYAYENALFVDRFSYCKNDDITRMKCEGCADRTLIGLYDPPSKASSQVVVVHDTEAEEILVGFRGTTKSIKQWLSNLDTKYDKWYEGRVHSGFHDRFLEIKDQTFELVKKAKERFPDSSLIISGHSMGGAVATLFSSYLKHLNTYIPDEIHTFGSPRVGDQTFASYVDRQYGEHLIRWMNEWDMVTDLPPKLLKFRHTGKLMTCKTSTTNCQEGKRMEENRGGLVMGLKRTIETAKNVDKCHLTYLEETIGTNRLKC